jgi:hypothetical protein
MTVDYGIVIANFGSNNVGVLLGYDNGSFAKQTSYSSISGLQFVAVADFNSDTLPYIIVALQDTSSTDIHLGYSNGTFASLMIFLAVMDLRRSLWSLEILTMATSWILLSPLRALTV